MLESLRKALRLTTDIYDAELNILIGAAVGDLTIAGITTSGETTDPLLIRAIITYCWANFYRDENMKKSYDEQKAQLQMSSNYGLKEGEA